MSTMSDFVNSGASNQAQVDANTNAIKALSGRNKIINGHMKIAQRGTTFTPAQTTNLYTVDRWRFAQSGASACSADQILTDAPTGFPSCLKLTVTTADTSIAAADFAVLQQVVEGHNILPLMAKTFTLSFWVKTSKVGKYCVGFITGKTPNYSYISEYTINAANTWEKKSITVIGGIPTISTPYLGPEPGVYVDFTLMAGSDSISATLGSWFAAAKFSSSNQVNLFDTVGATFFLTGVQLEAGEQATEFEYRSVNDEISSCLRYYQSGSLRGNTVFRSSDSTVYCGSTFSLPTYMRIVPTFTYSGVGQANKINLNGVATTPSAGGPECNTRQITMDAFAPGAATNTWWQFDWTASSEM